MTKRKAFPLFEKTCVFEIVFAVNIWSAAELIFEDVEEIFNRTVSALGTYLLC